MAALLAAAPPEATETSSLAYRLVDLVVADVDGAVITYSELLAEANLVLLKTRGIRVARSAQLNRALLRAILSSMVHRELLLAEIRRLQLRLVENAEVERRLQRLKARFKDSGTWRRFLVESGFIGVDSPTETFPASIRARERAEAQVDQFLKVRVRLNVVITEADVARCFAARQAVFGPKATLSMVAPRIRAQLRHQREAFGLLDLVAQLTDRAHIRYEPDFEPPPLSLAPAPQKAPGSGFTCPR
ncbi:MAG: hypothetical protein AAF449_15380 [Myxococcota bacterium]